MEHFMGCISTNRAAYNRVNPNIRIGSRKPKNQELTEKSVSYPTGKLYVGTNAPIFFELSDFNLAKIRKATGTGNVPQMRRHLENGGAISFKNHQNIPCIVRQKF